MDTRQITQTINRALNNVKYPIYFGYAAKFVCRFAKKCQLWHDAIPWRNSASTSYNNRRWSAYRVDNFKSRSAATRSKSWLIASIIGALGVFVALTNGLAFIFNDDDVTSFIMALGFIVAATTYSTALSFSEKTSTVTKINNSEKVKTLNGRVRHSHS
jgi:hypothetical protein